MKNQSGCVDASEVGAEQGNARLSGGLVTVPPPPHVSLVIAKEIRSETVIVSGTVLGSENETGIGLLDVVVGMAVRAVPAAGAEVAADTVEATETATATGHWPREWDSKRILSHQHAGTDLHELTAIYGPKAI